MLYILSLQQIFIKIRL